MPSEIKSLLTLILPIMFILAVGIIGTLKEYGVKNFFKNMLETISGGIDVILYISSLYYIYVLFKHIEADAFIEIGLKIIIVACWFVWVLSKHSAKNKEEEQAQTISVINKRRKETENEIKDIEAKWDSIEQRLEEISQEKEALFNAMLDYDLDINRIKQEGFTAENKTEIKRLSKLRKSVSEEKERSEYEENRLKNEIALLSKSLGGYKSALHSIKKISETIEGYDYNG